MTGQLYVRKPGSPFRAFQWFKLGDGPEGVIASMAVWQGYRPPKCDVCGETYDEHGHLEPAASDSWPSALICQGLWLAEVEQGEWRPFFTPEEFADYCSPSPATITISGEYKDRITERLLEAASLKWPKKHGKTTATVLALMDSIFEAAKADAIEREDADNES